jgi:hypothetical protein
MSFGHDFPDYMDSTCPLEEVNDLRKKLDQYTEGRSVHCDDNELES